MTQKPLRALRWEARLTQAELAERIGVRPATVSDWERFKNMPSGEALQKLAAALGCSADDIDLTARAVA